MFECWRLNDPKLLISITGSARSLEGLNKSLEKSLKRGLVKAALDTDAWIITGGSEEGIMRIIGEGVNEMATAVDPEKKITLLGITNWTTITNFHMLVVRTISKNRTKDYKIDLFKYILEQ
jgi:hypothetical protein